MKASQSQTAKSSSIKQTISAKAIRCGCTPYQKLIPDWHGHCRKVCPNPRAEEDLSVVSFWHRSPLKRLAFWIRRRVLRQIVHA